VDTGASAGGNPYYEGDVSGANGDAMSAPAPAPAWETYGHRDSGGDVPGSSYDPGFTYNGEDPQQGATQPRA